MYKAIISFSQLQALLLSFCATATDLLLLGTSAYIIATAAFHPSLHVLALSITLVRACGLFRSVFRYGERYISHEAAFKLGEKINCSLYKYAVNVLPLRNGFSEGDFLQSLNKTSVIWRDFYIRGLAAPLVNIVLIVIAIIVIFPLTGAYSLLLFSCWLLGILIPYFVEFHKQKLEKYYALYREKIIDFQQGWAEIKNGAQEDYFLNKLNKGAKVISDIKKRQSQLTNISIYSTSIYNAIVFIMLFYLLLLQVKNGSITMVELAVLVISLEALLAELSRLRESAEAVAEAFCCNLLENIPVSAEKNCKHETLPKGTVLAVKELSFSYDAKVPVLEHVNFSIHEGEKIAIIGDSGTGKTTLFYLLLGIWTPDKGSIIYNGGTIAAATQGNYIFDCSIRENFLKLYPDINDDKIKEVLEIAQFPWGLDYVAGENGRRLSGGQRQRLLTALALAGNSPVILLDEPTCGLDRKTGENLLKAIIESRKDATIIVITHDDYAAELMNRKIRLKK